MSVTIKDVARVAGVTVCVPIAGLCGRTLERLVVAIEEPSGSAAMHQALGIERVVRDSSAAPTARAPLASPVSPAAAHRPRSSLFSKA